MLWKVVGYIRLKFCGDNIYGFIDDLKKKEIALKNMKKLAGVYYGDILSSNLKKVVKLSKEWNIEVSVEGRFGLAMKIFIYRNRVAFMLSSLLFLIAFVINCQFVKRIYVTGNSYLTDSQIKSVISQCGIYEGRFIPTLKADIAKEEILKECDHLSWVWVYIKGTSAYVDVREKIPKPQIFNSELFCNVVAEKDGVVMEAIAESGLLYAKEGNFVKKGDLLIGGVYDSNEYAPVRFVHSKGSVRAKTTYTLEDKIVFSITKYKIDDKAKNIFGISGFDNSIKFGHINKDMNLVSESKKQLKIFGKNYFSLGFTNNKYCEIIKEEYKMGYNEASETTIRNLTMRLKSTLPDDAKIIDVKEEIYEDSNGVACARVTFECIEDIGVEVPLDISP